MSFDYLGQYSPRLQYEISTITVGDIMFEVDKGVEFIKSELRQSELTQEAFRKAEEVYVKKAS